jgi:hypothetical protein
VAHLRLRKIYELRVLEEGVDLDLQHSGLDGTAANHLLDLLAVGRVGVYETQC